MGGDPPNEETPKSKSSPVEQMSDWRYEENESSFFCFIFLAPTHPIELYTVSLLVKSKVSPAWWRSLSLSLCLVADLAMIRTAALTQGLRQMRQDVRKTDFCNVGEPTKC